MILVSPEGNNIFAQDDIAATTLTYSTANQLTGASVTLRSVDVNGTPVWLAIQNGPQTLTAT
jgi:hypothetical protein